MMTLTACGNTGGLGFAGGLSDPLNGPPSVNGHGAGVAGLSVGHNLMAAGEFELALKAYYRAAGEEGVTPDVLASIGSANLKLGRLGQAEKVLRSAIEMDPNSVPALNNLGVVLMETGDFGEASEFFERAYALDSGQTDSIRENLKAALAKLNAPTYDDDALPVAEEPTFDLVLQDNGEYLLLSEF